MIHTFGINNILTEVDKVKQDLKTVNKELKDVKKSLKLITAQNVNIQQQLQKILNKVNYSNG